MLIWVFVIAVIVTLISSLVLLMWRGLIPTPMIAVFVAVHVDVLGFALGFAARGQGNSLLDKPLNLVRFVVRVAEI